MSRLVLASNRLDLPPGHLAPGGVSVSLAALLRQRGGLWFGWSGQVSATRGLRRHVAGAIEYATVDLDSAEYAGFYNGYSNGVLWPLCHGLPPVDGPQQEWPDSYARVNARYAAQLSPLLRPDDTVWVHDYHLLPLGAALRAAGSPQTIGFFLHVPFPPLVTHADGGWLLEALTAYDLVGFQTGADLAAFHHAARSRWGTAAVRRDGTLVVAGRTVATGVFPLGVEVDRIQAVAAQRQAQMPEWWPRGVGERARSRIIGADRLDASKGLAPRLGAYAAFLSARGSGEPVADYLQFVTPSRADLPDRGLLRETIEKIAATINRQHATADAMPLRCVHHALPHDELMGVLAGADVGLVTPLRDGMNLLAKEFVAAQPAADPGVLVLSTTAGAARELEAALLVDPLDLQGMAAALAIAVRMPLGERRERHAAMLAALRRHDLATWRDAFLQRLREAAAARQAVRPPAPARALP